MQERRSSPVSRRNKRPGGPAGFAVLGVTLAVAACSGPGSDKPPTGDVLAKVDGREITVHDVNAEARATGVQATGRATRMLLQRVVARVLLAQSARAQKLDQDPDYPADRLRLEEEMLAQKALQKVKLPTGAPSDAEVKTWIADHPWAFENRQRFALAQARFRFQPSDPPVDPSQTLDAVVAALKARGTPVQTGAPVVDTAQMNPADAAKLAALPLDKLLVVRQGDSVLVTAVRDRQPLVLPPDQQTALAARMIAQQRAVTVLDAQVAALRRDAKVSYQAGYAP